MVNAFIFDENFNSNTYTKLYAIDFEIKKKNFQ